MARISLSSNLAPYTGGETALDLDVGNVRQLFRALGERYPELAPRLESELAVAIDGVVYQDSLLAPIGCDSEVTLFSKIAGG
ncbi:MAG: hypothetical protein A3G25_20430 [Betaproteobacteria bacterium RIFCSPLOWO2_12_FULL_63_13]|nr:MAG: hypothetical protein A3G25_20430 [Betaproteobacteria bacterium RIFCSPLOWO2_12_FULL_63_13]